MQNNRFVRPKATANCFKQGDWAHRLAFLALNCNPGSQAVVIPATVSPLPDRKKGGGTL